MDAPQHPSSQEPGTLARLALWTGFEGTLTPAVDLMLRDFADRVGAPAYALAQAMAQVSGERQPRTAVTEGIPPTATTDWAAAVEKELESGYGVICDLSRFREIWIDLCRPNPAWIKRLETLKAQGAFIGLLTEVPARYDPSWLRMIAPGLFDARLAWPADLEPAPAPGTPARAVSILRQASIASSRPAAMCLLVDSLEHHCEAAREAGWQAVVFRRTGPAVTEVDRLLNRGTAIPVCP